MTYTITVEVTDVFQAPGDYVAWSFDDVPDTFVGTFDADDTNIGFVSNFSLTIGGFDIALSHPSEGGQFFDPNTLEMEFVRFIPGQSVVHFGPSVNLTPSNYVVAFQSGGTGPLDPYFGYPQNWVGTYEISPSSQTVPEPGSILAMLSLVSFGAGAVVIRRRRAKKIAA